MRTAERYDVLVIGAGPAGSAAAHQLAACGFRVALVDRCQFPRDKVCGDALLPDALSALEKLGLKNRVESVAHRVTEVRIYAPNGTFVTLQGECASVARKTLDDLLRTAAIEKGASFAGGWKALAPLMDDGAVSGAIFKNGTSGGSRAIAADMTILAAGAASDTLRAFGVCTRTAASATAARLYIRAAGEFHRRDDYLSISFQQDICPGYGWIFPIGDGVFNVGVGYFYDARKLPKERNVRLLLERFLRAFQPAADLMRGAERLTPLKGAPLRTALSGAHLSRPGLLVAGESAGLTYSASGEGIGKALESGLMAAEVIAGLPDRSRRSLDRAAADYPKRLHSSFDARFRAYRQLQRCLMYPSVANWLARRANAGGFVRAQLEQLFNETGNPDELLSFQGVLRAALS